MPYWFGRREGTSVQIEGDDARHLAGPLRARAGELIQVVETEGRLLEVRLTDVSRNLVAGEVVSERPHQPEPPHAVWLAVAMLPASSLELVLSRCTEAGAAGFRLIQAERSIAQGSKPQRWATICREAAMLAGRLVVPEVHGPLSFEEVFRTAENPWLMQRGSGSELGRATQPVTLFIGPEGGWSPSEAALAGERTLDLGPRNLRADTAALVALARAVG